MRRKSPPPPCPRYVPLRRARCTASKAMPVEFASFGCFYLGNSSGQSADTQIAWTHLGIQPKALRMRSGCDTTKPCALLCRLGSLSRAWHCRGQDHHISGAMPSPLDQSVSAQTGHPSNPIPPNNHVDQLPPPPQKQSAKCAPFARPKHCNPTNPSIRIGVPSLI